MPVLPLLRTLRLIFIFDRAKSLGTEGSQQENLPLPRIYGKPELSIIRRAEVHRLSHLENTLFFWSERLSK